MAFHQSAINTSVSSISVMHVPGATLQIDSGLVVVRHQRPQWHHRLALSLFVSVCIVVLFVLHLFCLHTLIGCHFRYSAFFSPTALIVSTEHVGALLTQCGTLTKYLRWHKCLTGRL